MKKRLLILFLPLGLFGQNTIGLPDVINYSRQSYNAGLQNWDFKQDKSGIVYAANNEGLLSFDGENWQIHPLPNQTIVRSVEIGFDNRIYVGGQDELGYFSPSKNGRLQYFSLTQSIPEKDRSFGDVWDIVSFKKDIYFRSTNKIFKLTNGAISLFQAPSEWSYLGLSNDKLYAHDYKTGLMSFENDRWTPLRFRNILPDNDPVTAIIPLQKYSSLITTLKNGLYIISNQGIKKLNSAALTEIAQKRIYAATAINTERIALATNNDGVFIIDLNGKLIQNFSKIEGLQDNNILSIFLDQQSNLWLGLNNGIDFIAYNSAIKRIIPLSRDGSGYAAIIHNHYLYIGTSGGLFSVPLQPTEDLSFSKGNFSPVANTTGQTWCLAEINGKLLLGHHEGAFMISDNTARPISTNHSGFWNFIPLSSVFPSATTVAGNYKGLTFFNYLHSSFSPEEKIAGFNESSRFVAMDADDNIWVSHPYHGVYKISIAADGKYKTKLYTNKNGLPSALNNHVYKIKNKVVVATVKGIYTYNGQTDDFAPSQLYKKILGDQSIRYLKEDHSGNIWFIHEKIIGVVDFTTNDTAIIYIPELNNKMLSGFEFIYPVNENNIFLGGEKGFFHINYKKYKSIIPALSVLIRNVKIINKKDSLLFGGYFDEADKKQIQDKSRVPTIQYNWRAIRFEFSAPVFGQQASLQYSYRIKGFDDNWSEWTYKTEKEYTNLPAGTYTFEVKAGNNLGNESEYSSYIFKILPPWYLTAWAYIIYSLLIGGAIYFLYKWLRKKFYKQQAKYEEEQKKLQYLHQLEINKAENELVALRNEKLQSEIDFKNSELATSAMHLVQRGELLTKIKSDLHQIMKGLDNEKAVNELKKMIKILSEDDKMDKDWEHFAQHFDKVHSNFVSSLKEKYPSITPHELKLCAYLRMNLSTKEIAQLMNISVRGVEISRYRLRKKLGISGETNLFNYLINI